MSCSFDTEVNLYAFTIKVSLHIKNIFGVRSSRHIYDYHTPGILFMARPEDGAFVKIVNS